ncbi:dynein axonemal heavy chain 8-like [Narcine bancroftii]|uniref:dynein axonemal heavy chain 8-like n=1 Tax=Narcine bancroftii TaxID=1343680 RepID=UPI0038322FE5
MQLKELILKYTSLFPDIPKRTSVIYHNVDVGEASPIKQHPYRINIQKTRCCHRSRGPRPLRRRLIRRGPASRRPSPAQSRALCVRSLPPDLRGARRDAPATSGSRAVGSARWPTRGTRALGILQGASPGAQDGERSPQRGCPAGLSKLMEATESVARLAEELARKEKELAVASHNADKVLGEVRVSAEAAEVVKNAVLMVKDKAQKIVDEIAVEKHIAEDKLIAAKPALEAAEAALNTIKPADIATVRKLATPPHLIMRILNCVLVLFQNKMEIVTMDPENGKVMLKEVEDVKLLRRIMK